MITAFDTHSPLCIEDAKRIPEHMKQKKEGKNSGRQNRQDWEHAIDVSCVLGRKLFFFTLCMPELFYNKI